jgi:hypothetical protein
MTAHAALDRFRARDVTDPPPDLASFAALLYDALAPLATLDGQADWHLAHYCGALGAMFQPVADVARDTPAGPGWSAVLDLDRCPDAWLPWLAQFVGVTVIAAQATLTGNRTVTFRERDSSAADPPYTLEIVTLTGETPDPAATRAAIIAQKPGGILLNYRTVAGQDWQAVQAKTWRAAKTTYASWRTLRDNV